MNILGARSYRKENRKPAVKSKRKIIQIQKNNGTTRRIQSLKKNPLGLRSHMMTYQKPREKKQRHNSKYSIKKASRKRGLPIRGNNLQANRLLRKKKSRNTTKGTLGKKKIFQLLGRN